MEDGERWAGSTRLQKHCRLMSQLIKAQHQWFDLAVCDLIVKTYLLLIQLDDGINEDLVMSTVSNKKLNWPLLFTIIFYSFLFVCLFLGESKGEILVQKSCLVGLACQMVCFRKFFVLVHNDAHQTFGKIRNKNKLKNKNNLLCVTLKWGPMKL